MSERGRWNGGGHRGGGGGGQRGGGGRGGGAPGRGRGGGGGGFGGGQRDFHQRDGGSSQPKKENILDLSKYMDKEIRVKLNGGREVVGKLKGYDHLLNLVLDDTREFIRDPADNLKLTDKTRNLGVVVCRGTAVFLIGPEDGMEEIANPYLQLE